MKTQDVEKWLLKESKNNNALAKTYLSLLENATPEMKEHWFQMLGSMLGAVMENDPEIRKHLNLGK